MYILTFFLNAFTMGFFIAICVASFYVTKTQLGGLGVLAGSANSAFIWVTNKAYKAVAV